ncbi:Myrcene synthase, chloroplastic [Musa troglodytarum]|uniref:Myrcene synthase, chloroplastic n=1 Tax=Musa troglodytarum TaxID=320322 RepID=A0A9E7GMW3_9LILI|nr:Myrcene synthase, chloroplastic [Musa troglodytarum]
MSYSIIYMEEEFSGLLLQEHQPKFDFGFASCQVIRSNNVSTPSPYRLCHILPLLQLQDVLADRLLRTPWQSSMRLSKHQMQRATSFTEKANYQPNLWTHDYIQSLTSDHSMEEPQNAARISKLEEEVVKLIQEEKELEDQLQLIDHLQQLGVAYHFKEDIKDALGRIHGSLEDKSMLSLCNSTSL